MLLQVEESFVHFYFLTQIERTRAKFAKRKRQKNHTTINCPRHDILPCSFLKGGEKDRVCMSPSNVIITKQTISARTNNANLVQDTCKSYLHLSF